MSPQPVDGLAARPALSARERDDVMRLAARCNAHEGLDLKLNLDAAPEEPDAPEVNQLFYYAAGALIGYCSIDAGSPVELCGMVHPEHRRHGAGRALLDAAAAECRRRGHTRVLVLCEEASSSGHAFVAAAGGLLRFAEHRMELDAPPTSAAPSAPPTSAAPPTPSVSPAPLPDDGRFYLHEAGRQDIDTLARVQSAIFDDPADDVRRGIAAAFDDPLLRFYLARLGDTPVSSLRLFTADGRASIYAFGIVPAYRRRGLGRRVLDAVAGIVQAEGTTRLGLEVETDNTAAIALYRASGYRVTTTYGYYRLEL